MYGYSDCSGGPPAARRGLILVVLAAVLWGTSGVATKAIYAVTNMDAISVAAFRLALGAPLLLIAFRCTALVTGASGLRVPRPGADAVGRRRAGHLAGPVFAAIASVGVAIATLVTISIAPVLVCLFSLCCCASG